MGHVELHELDRDHLDETAAALGGTEAEAIGEWMPPQHRSADAAFFSVTHDGSLQGLAAAVTMEGRREVTIWVTDDARSSELPTVAVRLLVSRTPERPLYLRAASADAATASLVHALGFTETTVSGAETVYVLPPTLE